MNMMQNQYMPYQPRYNPMSNGITWVQGIEGAKAYQLAPNSNTVMLDSDNEGIFYIKVCDSIGMCTLRTFQYTELTEIQTKPKQLDIDMSNYITRDEFNALIAKLGGNNDGKQSVSTAPTKSGKQ